MAFKLSVQSFPRRYRPYQKPGTILLCVSVFYTLLAVTSSPDRVYSASSNGEMTEERFELGPDGMPQATEENRYGVGDITLAPGHLIHRISNRTDSNLVTLHIYSPPLDSAVTHFTPVPTYAEE